MRYSAAQRKPLSKSGPPAPDADKMRWNGSLKKPLSLQKTESLVTKSEPVSPSVPPKTSSCSSPSSPSKQPKVTSALGPGLQLKKWPGHEVHKGIFLGDLSCALDLTQLKQRNITHVLTATNRMKPMFPDDLHYLVLDFPDSADQNLLDAFAAAHEFIAEAHAAGGAVLIHCMAGQSRSVTVRTKKIFVFVLLMVLLFCFCSCFL
jgi:hypothetical protein